MSCAMGDTEYIRFLCCTTMPYPLVCCGLDMTCASCGTVFTLTDERMAFYEKFGVPPQAVCFVCDQQHKLSFRNGRTLYRRTCDATGESIISIYAPDAPYTVYKREYW